MKAFHKPLRAAAVGFGVFLIVAALHASGLLSLAELKALDHRFQHYSDPEEAGHDLVLVAVDELSLEDYGRWPWPRDRYAFVVDYLKAAGAKAIVFDILFPEADENAEEFDEAFAVSVRQAGNVYLPGLLQRDVASPPAEGITAKAMLPVTARDGALKQVEPGQMLKAPFPPLAHAAKGIGYINFFPDLDGTKRRLPPVIERPGAGIAYLQLATVVARDLLEAKEFQRGEGYARLGPSVLPLTPEGDLVLDWYGGLEPGHRVYPAYSIGAVLHAYAERRHGKDPTLDPGLFKDKIVFVAGTAAGTYDLRVTPMSSFTPGVLIHMTALDNILRSRALTPAPPWAWVLTTLVLCLATAAAFMLLQRQLVKFALIVGLAVAYYILAVHAFTGHGLWLELAFPEGAMALTYAAAATMEYLTEGKRRRQLKAAFDRYMGAEVVEEITRDPTRVRLGGERKELTVLFSDVAGFTTISEKISPEALVDLLNEYLSEMTAIIFRHRGNVNKYLGDGIMAIFGAPLGEPNHASLACYAALDSQTELTRLRQRWLAMGHPDITARIGINSGPLIVGNMGSQARMEYTVMGDSVNLSSRLEGANKYYGTLILLGPRTFELAAPDIEAREVDLLRVKGKHEPVRVYELLARKGGLESEQAAVVRAYRDGLEAYKRRDFQAAVESFEAALSLKPSDGPSLVYLERSRAYVRTPPPADWDGVYALHDK